MLIAFVTKDYLHDLDDKFIQLDAKLAQIRMLIEKENTVTFLPNVVHEDEFEVSAEACKESVQCQKYVEAEAGEQRFDKLNQIGKHLADMSKLVKENTNEESTQSRVMSSDLGIIFFASVMATLGLQILLESGRELVTKSHIETDPQKEKWMIGIMVSVTVVKFLLMVYCHVLELKYTFID